MSTALVLGAGGQVGRAFHAGALAALAELGHEVADPDLVIGTSAGASTAASLRAGLDPGHQLAIATRNGVDPEIRDRLDELPTAPDFSLTRPSRGDFLRPLSPGLAVRSVLRRERPRFGLAVAGGLPRGTGPTAIIGARINTLHRQVNDGPWPERPTWIVALRVGDGRRIVFGRDADPEADVGTAAAASSAVPGLLAPVVVDGQTMVDGGTHSPTNADLAAGLGHERVIVVSTMTGGTDSAAARVRRADRWFHRRLLDRELDHVRRSGAEVLMVEPTEEDLGVMAGDPMSHRRGADVAEQAYRSVLHHHG